MATPILRKIDRWRFETPLGLALAAAAGFAVMAMPHPLFARIPTLGGFGRPGQIALAVLAALVCGGLGYFAMRSPAKRLVVAEDEEYIEDLHAPVDLPAAAVIEDEPLRLRRADRHPDAPPRAPIRASRDLGEPFMEVGTPASPSVEQAFAEHEPVEVEHHELDAFEIVHPVEAEPVEAEAEHAPVEEIAVEHVENVAVEHEPVVAEPLEHVAPEPVAEEPLEHHAEPIAEATSPEVHAEEPAHEAPAPDLSIAAPTAVETPTPRPLPSAAREDASISAMMERLSAGMQRRAEAIGRPLGAARDKSLVLRDALDELNRLAERRG